MHPCSGVDTTVWIMLKHRLHLRGQGMEPLPHARHATGQVNVDLSRGQHQPPLNVDSTPRMTISSTAPSTRTRTPSGNRSQSARRRTSVARMPPGPVLAPRGERPPAPKPSPPSWSPACLSARCKAGRFQSRAVGPRQRSPRQGAASPARSAASHPVASVDAAPAAHAAQSLP